MQDKKDLRERAAQTQKTSVAEAKDGQAADANGGADASKDAGIDTQSKLENKGNRKKEQEI